MTSLDKLKVTLLSWDGEKDQPPYTDWLANYSDLIRSLADGSDELELFLDAKLGRRINARSGQPSFLKMTTSKKPSLPSRDNRMRHKSTQAMQHKCSRGNFHK